MIIVIIIIIRLLAVLKRVYIFICSIYLFAHSIRVELFFPFSRSPALNVTPRAVRTPVRSTAFCLLFPVSRVSAHSVRCGRARACVCALVRLISLLLFIIGHILSTVLYECEWNAKCTFCTYGLLMCFRFEDGARETQMRTTNEMRGEKHFCGRLFGHHYIDETTTEYCGPLLVDSRATVGWGRGRGGSSQRMIKCQIIRV